MLCLLRRFVLLVESVKDTEVQQQALTPRQGLPDVSLGIQLLPLPRRLEVGLVLGDSSRPEHVLDLWVSQELINFGFGLLEILKQILLRSTVELLVLMVFMNRSQQQFVLGVIEQ